MGENMFLQDTKPEKAFWATNGVVCRNIYELVSCIEGMNEFSFRYHVNEDKHKNDFAKWINEVLKDGQLANRLKDIKEKDRYSDIIRQRIKQKET